MSGSTENLNLFKYDTATDGKQVFSIDNALNDNWDKLDTFAQGIKDLSNLSEIGEKRFSDINTELEKKLEAEVLLAENGYIKFNNGFVIQWLKIKNSASGIYNLPVSLNTFVLCVDGTDRSTSSAAGMSAAQFSVVNLTQLQTWMSHTQTDKTEVGHYLIVGS